MHSFMSTPQLVNEVGTLVAMEIERKRLEEILSEDPRLEVCCYIQFSAIAVHGMKDLCAV